MIIKKKQRKGKDMNDEKIINLYMNRQEIANMIFP